MILSELDMIIVPSEHAKKAFSKSGVSTSIVVVPHAFDEERWPYPKEAEANWDRERDRFVFYTIATPIERKNLVGLMRAYFKAFESRRDVVLRIKSSATKGQLKEMAVKALEESGVCRDDRPPLRFFTGKWPIEQIRAFHLDGDCYVSATRAEGFGLCECEGKLCASRVVTTAWGAAPEILDGHDILVDYELVPVFNMQGIGCYEPEQMWAEPDDDSLAAALIRAHKEKSFGTPPDAWLSMQARYGRKAVGDQLAAALQEAQRIALEDQDDE